MNKFKSIKWQSLKHVEMVGEGSFGKIYKAKHEQWNMNVAVKELRDISEELLSEAEKMHHASSGPNIIGLLGIVMDTTVRRYGIVMEYMELGSLYQLLQDFPQIDWALKFRLIYEVAKSMNWLHNLTPPLLHLDLKSTNVLLDEDLHVKISDFGLSKFTQGSSNSAAEVGGTVAYMPPEAFRDGYQPNQSSDVYSFGILSCVVLTGNEPYDGACSTLISIRIREGDRPLIDSLKKETSVACLDEAVHFIEQCWHKDKNQRPSFRDCCITWENCFSAHRSNIINAVRSLLEQISKKAAPETKSTLSTANSNMTDVIQGFEKKLKITKEASAKQFAAPATSDSRSIQKTSCNPVSQSQHQQNMPRSEMYGNSGHMQSPQIGNAPTHQQYNYPAGGGYLLKDYQAFNHYPYGQPNNVSNPGHPQPTFNYPSMSFNSINILGNAEGIQIGTNNVMNICHSKPRTHQSSIRSKAKPRNTTTVENQPQHTSNIQGSVQTSTRQSQDARQSQSTVMDPPFLGSSQTKETAQNSSSITQIYPPPNAH